MTIQYAFPGKQTFIREHYGFNPITSFFFKRVRKGKGKGKKTVNALATELIKVGDKLKWLAERGEKASHEEIQQWNLLTKSI